MSKGARQSGRGRPNDRKRKTQPLSGGHILIVCEGTKTEPNYFKKLRKEYKNARVKITITDKVRGTDPLRVVSFAIDEIERQKKKAKNSRALEYNQVWCVIDSDQHTTLDLALDEARGNKIEIALSIPCFEVWFLLHFEYTTGDFLDCAAVEKALKMHLPGYSKSMVPVEVLDKEIIRSALSNAELLRKHNEDTMSENPSTDVDRVVKIIAFREESPG